MKKLILISVTIFLGSFTHSQNYFPFLDSNAIWNEFSIHVSNPQNVAHKIRYGIIGDTVINSQTYSKVYELIDDTCLNTYNATYFGALREDNERIYTITTWHGDFEILLYDFSKGIGDTIYSNSPEGYMAYPVVISDIDSVQLLDGSVRKRYWLEGCYYSFLPECWIEGCGSIHGLFAPIFDLITNYYEPHLSCFKQNDLTVYLNNYSCDKCFCTLEIYIKNNFQKHDIINVYPNPFNSSINFKLNVIENINRIELYNSNGCLLYTLKEIKTEQEIDLKELSSGIFYLIIHTDKRIYSKKLIKINGAIYN